MPRSESSGRSGELLPGARSLRHRGLLHRQWRGRGTLDQLGRVRSQPPGFGVAEQLQTMLDGKSLATGERKWDRDKPLVTNQADC